MEKRATSIINQTLKYNRSIEIRYIDDFGLELLNIFGQEEDINEFSREIKERHYY